MGYTLTSASETSAEVSFADGNVLEHYRYTASGEVEVYSPSGCSLEASKIENFVLWNSRRYDAQSQIHYYKYRHYQPTTGRWPSRDPLEGGGGWNLYGFVENDSISKTDYLGMSSSYSGRFYTHYLFGGGASMYVKFEDYDPGWGANKWSDYKKKSKECCDNKGDTSFDQVKNYDTNKSPGRVNVRLKGNWTYKTHGSNCVCESDWEITIDNDRYDWNSRPWGETDGGSLLPWKEAATRLGGIPPGTPFSVVVDGSRENLGQYKVKCGS